MADLLSLTGDVVGLGDSDVEDFHFFAPDTPHVMLQLTDGRSLMVLGITRDEARKLGVGFSEPLTLSLSTTALASPPVAVQEEGDAKDGARYREFFASGLPITFLGVEYRTKAELDAAIDAVMGDQP